MSQNDYQAKNYSFTWNNYQETQGWSTTIETFAKNHCEFVCYAEEKAPTTGTPHLQGYIALKGKKRLSTLKNMLDKKICFEKAKKCRLANYRYCSKEGKAWVYDSMTNFCGIIDKSDQSKLVKNHNKQKRTLTERLNQCIDLAKSGKMEEILTTHPDIYLKYKDKLDAIRLDTTKVERMYLNNEYGNFFKCHFLWLWGPTGTGKSYFCNILVLLLSAFMQAWARTFNIEQRPLRVYYKNKNKYWDRYNNEEIVIVEEASPETMKVSAHYYKQWIDEYPFNPEIKGATINYIRPHFFIITSNYSLRQCFTDPATGNIRMEDYEPLSRRLCEYHLTKRENPNWPNYDDLTIYLNTLKKVKTNHFKNIELLINNIVSNHNFKLGFNETDTTSSDEPKHNGHKLIYECNQCGDDQFDCKHYEEDTKTFCHFCSGNCTCGRLDNMKSEHLGPFSKKQKTEAFTEEEIIDIENNVELNNIKDKESTNKNENSDFCETPTYTVMVLDKITNTTEDYCCIKCKKPSNGLFCEDCAKVQIEYENHAMCNECHRFFTALIDSHCPECTIKLKEEYKKYKESKTTDETKLTPENAIPIEVPKTPEKQKSSWIEWEDTVISCNLYNIQSQVNWLYDNIFIDTKNFYFYQKKHNTIPSLLMIRMAIKMKMSKIMSIQKQYESKIGMDGKKSTLINFLKLDEETLRKRNSTYKNIIMQQKTIYSKLNRCLYSNGQKLLALDDNLKLKAFRNIYDVSDYLTKNYHKTITINYLDKEILDDLINNKE